MATIINKCQPTSIVLFTASLTIVSAGIFDHALRFKNPECHVPLLSSCKATIFPSPQYKVVAWYFNTSLKSCQKLYSVDGVHHCYENEDLPATKERCEELCSVPCKMSDGTNGICMLDEYCKMYSLPVHSRSPCGSPNVKCCPRSYQIADNKLSGPTVGLSSYDLIHLIHF